MVRDVARVTGKLIACFPVTPLGPLNYRHLERDKVKALSAHGGNYDAPILLSRGSIRNLKWWAKIIFHTSAPIHRGQPVVTLFTDASGYGWGAVCGRYKAQGKFMPWEREFSINTKEVLAIYYAFKAFAHLFVGKHMLIRSDNTTVVSFGKNMGGMSCYVLDSIVFYLWTMAMHQGSFLIFQGKLMQPLIMRPM